MNKLEIRRFDLEWNSPSVHYEVWEVDSDGRGKALAQSNQLQWLKDTYPTATLAKMWGVFKWQGENMYLGKDALKRFTHRSAAEKYADKLGGNVVARQITREGTP